MREIKFKVWNKVNNSFLSQKNLWFFYSLQEAMNGSKYYEAIEYTGLKDSKGAEIYEGDIMASEGEYKSVVKFGGGSFCIQHITKWISPWLPMRGITMDRYRVVGNIYENPELLEVDL